MGIIFKKYLFMKNYYFNKNLIFYSTILCDVDDNYVHITDNFSK